MTAIIYHREHVARMLGCSIDTVDRRIKSGQLKARRHGRQICILGEDLERFVKSWPAYLPPMDPTKYRRVHSGRVVSLGRARAIRDHVMRGEKE